MINSVILGLTFKKHTLMIIIQFVKTPRNKNNFTMSCTREPRELSDCKRLHSIGQSASRISHH